MSARPIDLKAAISRTKSYAAMAAYQEWRRKASSNIVKFIEAVGRDESGARLILSSLHRLWHVHFEFCWANGRRPFIEAPYAHGKTVNLIMSRVAFEVGQNVNIRTKIVCNVDDRAKERVMGCRQIMFSAPYRRLFPNVRQVEPKIAKLTKKIDRMTQHVVYVDRPGNSIDPTIHAAPVLGSGAGGRADLILFDDVVDLNNSVINPASRESVVKALETTWMGRLEPTGRVGGVGTPYHENDWYHRIRKDPQWCILRCPISEDRQRIDLEVYNPPPGYPIPMLDDRPVRPDWVEVRSSNLAAYRYDALARELDVGFRGEAAKAWRYFEVPQKTVDNMLAAESVGRYFARHVRPRYRGRPLTADEY